MVVGTGIAGLPLNGIDGLLLLYNTPAHDRRCWEAMPFIMCYNAWSAIRVGVSTARRSESILDGWITRRRRRSGKGGVGFSFNWDGIPDPRSNTIL